METVLTLQDVSRFLGAKAAMDPLGIVFSSFYTSLYRQYSCVWQHKGLIGVLVLKTQFFPFKVPVTLTQTRFLYRFQTMKQKLWLTLITYLAYCIDKESYKAIDYLKEQVRVLVEHQKKQNKRILLTNSQRMRVAAKAKRLSRKMLEQCTELFTADTIIGWYQKLIAEKYDGSQNRKAVGRPHIAEEIVYLVIRFKRENPRWGYKKIRDQVVYLG